MKRKNVSTLAFVINAIVAVGAATAAGDQLWREQVARPADSVIELESIPVDPNRELGNDSLPWREQVEVVRRNRLFVLESAGGRYAKSSDTRLWREQIRSDSAKPELVADGSTEHPDELHNE